MAASRKPLYWDYGHCRGKAYTQAVRLDDWKGIRSARTSVIQLYDLSRDIGEANDIASTNPRIVGRIRNIMDQAVTPSPRYRIGTIYHGSPIWKPMLVYQNTILTAGPPWRARCSTCPAVATVRS